ncbi:MAG: hypothetical protein U1G07_22420 [Verrucomicrobiota bacterium]
MKPRPAPPAPFDATSSSHRWLAFSVSLWAIFALTTGCETTKQSGSPASGNSLAASPDEPKGGAGRTFKNSVTGIFNPSQANVKIPFEGTEAEVVVKLSHFPANQHALDGIAALQTAQWDVALTHFQAALQEKPNNWSYHFALAVTQELKGNYPEAKNHYLEANRLKGGKEGYFDAQAGLKRIEARGQ